MKNAFSAYVFGSYERFIPFYIYSINKNYPDTYIVLFYEGKLDKDVSSFARKFERVSLYENFKIVNNAVWLNNLKIRGGGRKTLLRFLIEGKYFSEYDYVYFGDVDILILDEGYSLFDFHTLQIQKSRIPFSNKVRRIQNGQLSKRLTGLHFVETKPYFQKMNLAINNFLENGNYRNRLLHGINRDEELLYALNMECFEFNPEIIANNKRPWHGFHLGLVRGKDYLNKKTVAENSNLKLNEIKSQLANFIKEKEFIKIFKVVYCQELFYTYRFLNLKLPLSVLLKYGIKETKMNTVVKFKAFYKSLRNA